MGECEKMNNEKQEKIALINGVAEALNELKIESKEFLEEIESEKYSLPLKSVSRYQRFKYKRK